MSLKILEPATQIQVVYRKRPEDTHQETELFKFSSRNSADKFFDSITKNPDVESAKKL